MKITNKQEKIQDWEVVIKKGETNIHRIIQFAQGATTKVCDPDEYSKRSTRPDASEKNLGVKMDSDEKENSFTRR